MNTRDFLLEIGTEEIPAKFMNPALNQLKTLSKKILDEKRISYGSIESFGTPRRLVLYVKALAEEQKELMEEVKGPSKKVAFDQAGEPTKAVLGFARGQGVDVKELTIKEVGNVEYVFASKRETGDKTIKILSSLATEIIRGLNFPKPMRWGDKEMRFARPIRWLLALFGEEMVELELEGLTSDKFTYGHRFLSKGKIEINRPSEFIEKLRAGFVIVDQKERKELIWKQIQELAAVEKGIVKEDEELLEEVTYILEYPTALCGKFKEDYLSLPKEVLITPMREHQRYFPVLNETGELLNKFITVRNGTADYIEIVREGNEKVLSARLADAEFFYNEDLRVNLESNVEKLKKIVFQESLGTSYEKVQRVIALTDYLGDNLAVSQELLEDAKRTALLAKADLVSNMVYEFPELQGIMGQEYALKAGEKEAIAEGIFEHYLPRFAGDDLPQGICGTLVSIADKMDTIVGCFAVGIQPTGSQDPYALRRQALGISYIIINKELSLSLEQLIAKAYAALNGKVKAKLSLEETKSQVGDFFVQRVRNILSDKGFKYDEIDAVLAVGCDNLTETLKRADALIEFRQAPEFESLLTAYNRVNNLAQKAISTTVNTDLFESEAEKELYSQLEQVVSDSKAAHLKGDYIQVLRGVAKLQTQIDTFFESVMVMVNEEAVKNNRLALLKKISMLTASVADLTKIVA